MTTLTTPTFTLRADHTGQHVEYHGPAHDTFLDADPRTDFSWGDTSQTSLNLATLILTTYLLPPPGPLITPPEVARLIEQHGEARAVELLVEFNRPVMLEDGALISPQVIALRPTFMEQIVSPLDPTRTCTFTATDFVVWFAAHHAITHRFYQLEEHTHVFQLDFGNDGVQRVTAPFVGEAWQLGFEARDLTWGYEGLGPTRLALVILNAYLPLADDVPRTEEEIQATYSFDSDQFWTALYTLPVEVTQGVYVHKDVYDWQHDFKREVLAVLEEEASHILTPEIVQRWLKQKIIETTLKK